MAPCARHAAWEGRGTIPSQTCLRPRAAWVSGVAQHPCGPTHHVLNCPARPSLCPPQIEQIVTSTIAAGTVTLSAKAIYLVLTDNTITASSGFCSQ